jgi:PAS domain S-box-containing protein
MAEGLVSFVAFPLQAGSSFLGVIDMFSVRPLPPDPLLLDTLSGLGSEFAQYLLRDRVEQALRESEERFRGTFENAAVGVGHVDLEGRWLRVNARLCEITGYAREGLLSRTFQDITHPEDLEADLALVRRLLAGEIPTYSMEKRYLRPDGQAVWVQLTVSLIRRADGAPDYFIAVVEDIEDRKEAEARLRTALAVKDEFLGLVSHELRTPMTIILGMSAVIARGELDGQRAREMASDIADSAEVLNELIESMLLLARLEHEEEQPREPMLLGRTVGAVLERQRRRDPSRAYDLESRTSDTLVDAQPTWLERVIVNLVSNAAKYSHPGGDVRVVIEGGDGEVVLRVIDEGPGLAEADLAQVFEPFYRAPGAESRAPGTGLGLAISKRIIESLGGRIWARSDASGGSDFGFAIPLIASDDP